MSFKLALVSFLLIVVPYTSVTGCEYAFGDYPENKGWADGVCTSLGEIPVSGSSVCRDKCCEDHDCNAVNYLSENSLLKCEKLTCAQSPYPKPAATDKGTGYFVVKKVTCQ